MEQEYMGHSWASQERSLTFRCLSLQSYKRKIMRPFVYKEDEDAQIIQTPFFFDEPQ